MIYVVVEKLLRNFSTTTNFQKGRCVVRSFAFPFPKKIRSQLPLTYAGIVLLAALLIGAILVLVIGQYYQGMEQEYLKVNANGIAMSINGMAAGQKIGADNPLSNYKAALQNQVEASAFLIQSRVRILDQNHSLIADSGTPTQDWTIRLPRNSQFTLQPGGPDTNQTPPPISFSPARNIPPAPGDNRAAPPFDFSASRNLFGFMLQYTSSDDGARSNLKSEALLKDANQQPLGMVEISEGPEYGRTILNNVIRGWAIASLIALLASATIGWLASRQITRPIVALEKVASEMKEGNLAARAPRLQPAELTSLSDTFNQMAARIENNVQTLQRFVSDAAHELRTPLTALRADLEMASNEGSTQNTRELVVRSLDQVKRLEQLSKDLLDLSRIETQNDPDAGQQLLDLPELVLKASEIQASAAEQAGIDFQVELLAGQLQIMGNDIQLQRALNNLLENAVKFSAAGGYVKIKLEKGEDTAQITVEDNGIGIPPGEREFLFNRFHRGRNTHNYPGSGLGLAIAKAIVEKHHGEIGLLPCEEVTRFYIRLPLAK
jgi:signal transduction histidine kinase